MPGIIAALRDARNPFSILTKGTLLLRDLDLLEEAAEVTAVALNLSVGFTDAELSSVGRAGHPGPAATARRLLRDHGQGTALRRPDGPGAAVPDRLPCQLAETVRQIAAAGAASVSPDRAAPAARRPRVVPRLAGRAPPGPGAAVPAAVRRRRLRAQGLPAADLGGSRRPGARARDRPGQPGRGPPDAAPGTRSRAGWTRPAWRPAPVSSGRSPAEPAVTPPCSWAGSGGLARSGGLASTGAHVELSAVGYQRDEAAERTPGRLVVRTVPVADPGDLIARLPEPRPWPGSGAARAWSAGAPRPGSPCPPGTTGSWPARSGCASSSTAPRSTDDVAFRAPVRWPSAASPSIPPQTARCWWSRRIVLGRRDGASLAHHDRHGRPAEPRRAGPGRPAGTGPHARRPACAGPTAA